MTTGYTFVTGHGGFCLEVTKHKGQGTVRGSLLTTPTHVEGQGSLTKTRRPKGKGPS